MESDRDVYSLPHALEDLEDREVTVSIGGRTIANLRFADDIDGSAGEEEEPANVVECLDGSSTAYGIEISAEKIKLMTNNTSGINTEIKVIKQKLETVTSFKNLGLVITDESSKPEILSMTVLRKILRISYKDLVTNQEVCAKIQQAIGPHEDLLPIVRDTNFSGMVMSPVYQVWRKPSRKAQ